MRGRSAAAKPAPTRRRSSRVDVGPFSVPLIGAPLSWVQRMTSAGPAAPVGSESAVASDSDRARAPAIAYRAGRRQGAGRRLCGSLRSPTGGLGWALFARVFRWRFVIGWWLVVLFGMPVIALLLGLIFGGSLHTADLGLVLIKQLGSIVLVVVVINLWEETVWAGFFQTRLEARFNFVVAGVLTALPFAGVHIPLLLLDDQVSALSVLMGIAGLLILGIVIRLLMGVMMRDLQARVFIRFRAKSNSGCSRAQFVPNTAHPRSLTAIRGQPFPLHVRKPPSQSLTGFVFQAGHASSILVTRSKARA